jgi:hypothetical protein
MKVLTLRTAKALPEAYSSLSKFYVRIGGDVFECTSLHDAQCATTGFPQASAVTLMTPEAHKKYLQKKAVAA